jgi:CBS domain-containing protein
MNVKVHDLMVENVITAQPHHTIDRLRGLMDRNRVHVIPVVDGSDYLLGVVSSADLVRDSKGGTPVSRIMTQEVYTVPQYDDVHIAARVMRNHRIHHVVVTHEKKVVGVLSSFDLLRLVEEHRFVMKDGPTESRRKGEKRA